MSVVHFPISPREDISNELTGTLLIADDYFEKINWLLEQRASLTARQTEIIDTLNAKILAFQLRASVITQDRHPTEQADV